MNDLIHEAPYIDRKEDQFLAEIIQLDQFHRQGCSYYSNLTRYWPGGSTIESVPFIHVGLFKYLNLKTIHHDIEHERTLHSSSTSGVASKIILDKKSSSFQALSTQKILIDFVGSGKRPLLVLDSVKSLVRRGELSARIAAAMSLRPMASEIHFLLEDESNPDSFKFDLLERLLEQHHDLLVYGFSWILWQGWAKQKFTEKIRKMIEKKTFTFVHSGGWKKLEASKVSHDDFNRQLLAGLSNDSKVVDFYGLVEQIGIIFPLCEHNSRHVPIWADVLVRDSYTLNSLNHEPGQLQFLNTIAFGAPYHSVLTEDIGRLIPGECPCGRKGKRFELLGRIPKAEIRGCANV